MVNILNHSAININYEEANELLHVSWTAESTQISDDFFKKINLLYVEETSKRRITRLLLDTVHFAYTISIEMQGWVNTEILPKILGNGIKRVAFLTSSELISQLSIEQTMEELEGKIVNYFDNEAQARAWLMRA